MHDARIYDRPGREVPVVRDYVDRAQRHECERDGQVLAEPVWPAHAVNRATKYMTTTGTKSNSSSIEHKLHSLFKSVVIPLSGTKSKVKGILADLSLVTKADIDAMVETYFSRCTRTVMLQILKDLEITLENALQASYCGEEMGQPAWSSLIIIGENYCSSWGFSLVWSVFTLDKNITYMYVYCTFWY